MINTNTAYFSSLPGVLKVATIVFVIISISLGGHAYENSLYNLAYNIDKFINLIQLSGLPGLGRERFFLAILGMVLTISVISLFSHAMNVGLQYDRKLKLMDIAYHVLAAVFLLIAGSLIIASSRKINNDICHKWNLETSKPPPFTPPTPNPTDEPGTGTTVTDYRTEPPESTTEYSTTTEQPESNDTDITLTESDPLLSLLLNTKFIIQDFQGPRVAFSVLADEPEFRCQYRAEKEVAGTFAILGSLLFAFVAVILFLRLNSLPEPSPSVAMHDVAL